MKRKISIESLLLSLIICTNIVKFAVNDFSTNIIDILYILFVAVVFLKNFRAEKIRGWDFSKLCFIILVTLLVLFSFIFSIGLSTEAKALKLFVILLTMYGVMIMDKEKIKLAIVYSMAFISLYSFYIIFNFSAISDFMKQTNYLAVTFPIGLALSMSFAGLIVNINKKNRSRIILYFLISIVNFMALIRFSARGSILFPVIVALVFSFLLAVKNPKKYIKVFVILSGLVCLMYFIYINNASSEDLDRMLRIFENNEAESRWGLWNSYIAHCVNNGWFLVGGGTSASELLLGYYPHNLYLQYAGEFGILGVILCAMITLLVLRTQLRVYSVIFRKKDFARYGELLFLVSAGLLYLFLVHMKSNSIYDGGVLYIFMAIVMSVFSGAYTLFKKEYYIDGKNNNVEGKLYGGKKDVSN